MIRDVNAISIYSKSEINCILNDIFYLILNADFFKLREGFIGIKKSETREVNQCLACKNRLKRTMKEAIAENTMGQPNM